MSIISLPNQLTNGTVADASQVMANLNTIVNDYNGGINNSNLSPTIAITDSHLNQIQTAGKVNGTSLTNLAGIPSGAGVIPSSNLTYVNIQYPYVKVSDVESAGTAGGTATTGSWTTRVLNTTDNDTQSISSLASNQITLPAGTYQVRVSSIMGGTTISRIRLQNITGASTLILGLSLSLNLSTMYTPTLLAGQFTLSTSSALAVQYYASGSTNGNDLGLASNIGLSEVYTVAEFIKLQ